MPKWKELRTVRAWGVIYPDGHILLDTKFETERDAWRVALGWPDESDIENAKKHGYKAVFASIIY